MSTTKHIPVLIKEILQIMQPATEKKFLDCTFGGGGHTQALLDSDSSIQVCAIDCDPEAKLRAEKLTAEYLGRFHFFDMNFSQMSNLPNVDFHGILFDLGVSSFQLDSDSRGFSFKFDAKNDMRLNPREGISAADFLETASYHDLVLAIRDYGEEKAWKKVVQSIIDLRGSGQLGLTSSFAAIIEKAIPAYISAKSKIHPATKTFQGIRIAINQELNHLTTALPLAFDKLLPGGVLAVISFHSLEDRIVKRYFRKLAGLSEHQNDHQPQQSRKAYASLYSKKPIVASDEELQINPRSRSAKLRAIVKN